MLTTHRELQSPRRVYPTVPNPKRRITAAYSFSYKYYFTNMPTDLISLKLNTLAHFAFGQFLLGEISFSQIVLGHIICCSWWKLKGLRISRAWYADTSHKCWTRKQRGCFHPVWEPVQSAVWSTPTTRTGLF